jgi:glutamyl-tRNA synthetase
MSVRTRFAPSPTGYLHIGGARTALYNWLFTRKMGGEFFLRIEDTDKARSTDENTRAIYEGMRWLGLDWDNKEPFLQSTRTAVYVEHVQRLLEQGKAYRCYCTKEEIDAKVEAAKREKRPYRYDRTCRRRTAGDLSSKAGFPYVVRAMFEETGETLIQDLIKGEVKFDNREFSDEVVLRADGSPLYNLCVVIDDHEMKITHVLRGDDHLNNTPKQIQLYKAFGYDIPQFGHMPLIFGPDKKKVSKRSGSVVAELHHYQAVGYLPEAMINFLVRLGWSHGDEEIFTVDRLKEIFSVDGIGKSAGIFDIKKLEFLNQHFLKTKPMPDLIAAVTPFMTAKGWTLPDAKTMEAIALCTRERSTTLGAMADQVAFLFTEEPAWDAKAVEKFLKGKAALLDEVAAAVAKVEPFEHDALKSTIEGLAVSKGLKTNDVAQPARVALTGVSVGPPVYDVFTLLGRERVAKRLAAARAKAEA